MCHDQSCVGSRGPPPPLSPSGSSPSSRRRRPRSAAPTELFISEYVEGSSNNKALEIYNGTGAAGRTSRPAATTSRYYSNGDPSTATTIDLTGTVAAGDVFVLGTSPRPTPRSWPRPTRPAARGCERRRRRRRCARARAIIDVIGQIGFDPGTEWGSGLTSTADNTLRRKACRPGRRHRTAADAFDPAVEWNGFAHRHRSRPGLAHRRHGAYARHRSHRGVDLPGRGQQHGHRRGERHRDVLRAGHGPRLPRFSLACSVSGTKAFALSGGPTTFTLDPTTDLAIGDACTLTVSGARGHRRRRQRPAGHDGG